MIWFLFSFLICFSSAEKAQELDTVIISDRDSLAESPRSTHWPTTVESRPTFMNQTQLSDATNTFSGVQSRTQGSPTFSIRGSASSGRVLALFNDIPLNFASGFGASPIFLPKELIGNTVVIKGPASLFYGSQAMSGSINFLPQKFSTAKTTWTMSDTNESVLPWREGSLAHHSLHIATPIVADNKNHTQFSFFTETDDGQFPYQLKNSSGVRQHNSNNLTRVVVNGKHKMNQVNLSYDLIAGKQVLQSPGPTNFLLLGREDSSGLLASLSPEILLNDEHSVKSRLSYLKNDSEFLETGSIYETNLNTFIFQNQWHADWSHWLTTQLFVDSFHHQMDNTFSGNGLKEDRVEIAPIANIYFTPRFFLQTGARHVGDYDILLPSAGLYYNWFLFKNWLNYSEGFRSPSLSDLHSNSPFYVANPLLTPEKAKQWEVGFSKQQNLQFQNLDWAFDVRLFYIQYQDFMESFQVTPGVFSKQNLAEAEAKGFDIHFSWHWLNFENYYKYNYLETENITTGGPLRLSPKHQTTWGLFYTLGNFKLEAQNSFWHEYYDGSSTSPTRMDDWSQWNFFLHRINLNSLSFTIGVLNAFNEGKELTLNYPEPQRRYWAQITWKY